MYKDEESKAEMLKRNLIAIAAVISLLGHISIVMFQDRNYIATDGEVKVPYRMEFCRLFANQLLVKKVHPSMVLNDVFKAISKENYKVFEFSGKETLFYISERNENCEIVYKDDLGLRTFEIGMAEDYSNELYYKINSLNEKLNNPRG